MIPSGNLALQGLYFVDQIEQMRLTAPTVLVPGRSLAGSYDKG
jgi:hypothetical protein